VEEKKVYFNRLDSLRFIAFFLVMWQHAFSYSFVKMSKNELIQTIIDKVTLTGEIGVHIFFVISGFLITYLMILEERKQGTINLGYFYLRRLLRIWPLYYLVMFLSIFILPNLFNTFKCDVDVIKNLFFLNNFDAAGLRVSNIGIAWSVAIEEQFYLFWPILFILFRRKNYLLVFSTALFVFSTAFVILKEVPRDAHFHTFGNARFLMMGCIGAIVYLKFEKKISNSAFLRPSYIYFAYILILLFTLLAPFSQIIYLLTFIGLPILYLYCVINLVAQGYNNKQTLFSQLGKYTYGMYLYHPLIIIFVKIGFDLLRFDYQRNGSVNFILSMFSLIITIAISILSYEYFEKNILKFKNKFSIVKTRI
jgi:peptidoglycan/LPS O-acetylase OafA/YrhL